MPGRTRKLLPRIDRSAPRDFHSREIVWPFALSRGNRYSVSQLQALSLSLCESFAPYDRRSYFIRKNATRLLNPFVTSSSSSSSSSLALVSTRHFISRFVPPTLISDSLYQSHKAFHCHSNRSNRRFLFISIPPSGPSSPFPQPVITPPFATFVLSLRHVLSARFDDSGREFFRFTCRFVC